jgi:hypothetical protein
MVLLIMKQSKKRRAVDPRDEVLAKMLEPGPVRRRATGLLYPLSYYSRLYNIPLITIKKIHLRYNPAALDRPSQLLPLLINQPGPQIDLTGMERVVAARFAAGLKKS